MKAKKLYNDYIKGNLLPAAVSSDAENTAVYMHSKDGVKTYYFDGDTDALRVSAEDGSLELIENFNNVWVVSDSRSLDVEQGLSLSRAIDWLNDKCELHGMDAGDWQYPELWSGCEQPPSLYTLEEWAEIND